METVWTGVPAPISMTWREESWAVKASFSPEGDQLTPWTQPLAESICISTWEVETRKHSGFVDEFGCTEEKPKVSSSGVVEARMNLYIWLLSKESFRKAAVSD
jgi:hypothetical protein